MSSGSRLLTRCLYKETRRVLFKRQRPACFWDGLPCVSLAAPVVSKPFVRQLGGLTTRNHSPISQKEKPGKGAIGSLQNVTTSDQIEDWLTLWGQTITTSHPAHQGGVLASPLSVLQWFDKNQTKPSEKSLRLLLQGALFYPWKGRADRLDAFLRRVLSHHERLKQANTTNTSASDKSNANDGLVLQLVHKVMSAWIRSRKVTNAEKWLQRLEDEQPVSPHSTTYTIVLKAWSKASQPRKAEAILDRIIEEQRAHPSSSIHVTKANFEQCLQAWVKSGEPSAGSRAELLVLKMQEHSEPDLKSLFQVLSAWVESSNKSRRDAAARAQAVLTLMQEQQKSNRHLSTIAATTPLLLQAHLHVMKAWSFYSGKVGLEKTRALIQDLWEQPELMAELTPTHGLQIYTHLLTALSRSELPDMAEQAEILIGQEIVDRGLQVAWKTETYNVLLNVYAKAGDGRRAEETLKGMLKSMVEDGSNVEAMPNTKTFNAVILAWSKSKAGARAEELFLLMQQLKLPGVEPDVVTYNALLAAMGGSDNIETARRGQAYFDQLHKRSVDSPRASYHPNPVTYAQAMLLWSHIDTPEAVERAEALMVELLSSVSLRPTVVTYRALATVLGRNSHTPNKEKRLQEIKQAMRKL